VVNEIIVFREPANSPKDHLGRPSAKITVKRGAVPSISNNGEGTSRVWSVLPIGAEILPGKISVKVERPQRSEDVRP
jgi:hypothetical protein